MRTAFIEELTRQAREHPEIFLVVGDLGFSVVEPFADEFPDRFLNAGVAEQNMTGLAAGLASEGYHVFTYSIANFPTLRCLEQIRNDVCYHHLPVTIVAVGAGLAYGNLGYSHHGVQDLACLRGFPGIRIYSPGDPGETRQVVQHLACDPGPSYLRLGKAGERTVHERTISTDCPTLVRERNAPVAILATGSVLAEAVDAADQLALEGKPVDVLSFHAISAPQFSWISTLEQYRGILVVEEHVAAGGLGELLATSLSRSVTLARAHVRDRALSTVGSQVHLRKIAGLDADTLAHRMHQLIAETSSLAS